MITHSELPSLFLSHGAPDLPISGHPAAAFLRGLASRLPQPKGIAVVSAHWESEGLRITAAERLETIHDFRGFPRELYDLLYPARTERWLIETVRDALVAGGHGVEEDPRRGLDHGAWVPLSLVYPAAQIPVVQVSLDRTLDAAGHIAVGRALAGLGSRGVLVLGSGGSVHNLRALAPEGSEVPDWARDFDDWLDETLSRGDLEALAAYRKRAPHARLAQPSEEHFQPLLVAAGAGGAQSRGHSLHRSFSYGSIGMSAWAFGGAACSAAHPQSDSAPG